MENQSYIAYVMGILDGQIAFSNLVCIFFFFSSPRISYLAN